MSSVVTVMKAHPKVDDVQSHAVGLMVVFSGNPALLKHIARAGGGNAVAQAGMNSATDAEVTHCVPPGMHANGHVRHRCCTFP